MIQRVYERSKMCKKLHDVIVATDDKRIYNHVVEFGGRAIMTSENHPSGTDRCNEAAKEAHQEDVVINIQGDEPLIDPQQIEQLCRLFEDDKVEIASLCKTFEDDSQLDNPNRIKVVLNHNSEAIYFSRSTIPFEKNPTKSSYFRHIGIYAYKKAVLEKITKLPVTDLEKRESLEQLRWMYYGYKIEMGITQISTPNIDTPEDVDEVLKHIIT